MDHNTHTQLSPVVAPDAAAAVSATLDGQTAPQSLDRQAHAHPRLDRDSDPQEYDAAWGMLKGEFGDFLCVNEDSGEVWQYMGSFDEGDGWHHEFRHRDLPGSDSYTHRRYPATHRWPHGHREEAQRHGYDDRSWESRVDEELVIELMTEKRFDRASYDESLALAIEGGADFEVWSALHERLLLRVGRETAERFADLVFEGLVMRAIG